LKRDLATLLSEIKSARGPRLLLIFGDDLQVQDACKAIVDLLVPGDQRGFNLERFDGRTVSWDGVEASLRTPPFFPGTKVVWVENAPYFYSREQNSELGERILQSWSEGKQEEAAKLLLDLLVVEGWTDEQWEQLQPDSPGSIPQVLGGEGGEAAQEAAALIDYCKGRGMNLSARKGNQGHRLAEMLDQGLPEWDFLLLTAVQVDRRTRLYKRLEEMGLTLNLAVERDRTGKVSRDTLLEFMARRLAAAGKTLDAQAREMVVSRAADDLRALGHELDKLFLYAGERNAIRPQDVEAVVTDRGEGWIFDLTRSIAEREPLVALRHLARLMTQGEHPLKLLSVLAGELRRLLSARQLLETDLRGSWRRGMTYAQFQERVLQQGAPLLSRNGYADYMCFQRAASFSLGALRSYLKAVHEADLSLKSSGSQARTTMEKLILTMCARPGA
jgi:DNA polymerase-3 subunit delta